MTYFDIIKPTVVQEAPDVGVNLQEANHSNYLPTDEEFIVSFLGEVEFLCVIILTRCFF